jgi:ferredoxin
MDNPKVDPEVCTGCGICIDQCPMEAIVLEDGVAKIIDENCSNCRACVDECPIEAIG